VETVADVGDAVVAVVARDRLSSVLTAIHRGGQGHNARVLDAARGEIKGQLRRAGVTTEVDLDLSGAESVVVLIHAPGRIVKTAEMLQRTGVIDMRVVNRAGAEVPRPFEMPVPVSRARRAPSTPPVSTD
jgi:hypothetical protein